MLLDWFNSNILVPGWLSSVFWNVVVGFGVFYFTVYFVDRRAIKREEQKWKAAKNYAYVKVVSFTGNLIYDILPNEYMKLCEYVFYYGNLSTSPLFITNENYSNASQELYEKMLAKAYHNKKDVLDNLTKHIGTVEDLLSKYSNLLESDIVSALFTLKEHMEKTINLVINPDDETDTVSTVFYIKALGSGLLSFVKETEDIQCSLIKKADRIAPLIHLIKEVLEKDDYAQDFKLLQRITEIEEKSPTE